MRYALRNKDKIKAHFEPWGKQMLQRITQSLDAAFKAGTYDIKQAKPYEVLTVNDTGHTCGIIVFYVIGRMYDVYKLAFKEFIN